MNKVILLGVGALMFAVTSCSNDETVEVPMGNAIGFKTMVDKNASRAAVELTVANLTQFKVWGYAADGLIFNGQVVNVAGGTCTYTPLQYWEANKAYAFTAVGSNESLCTAEYTVAVAVGGKEGFGTVAFDNNAANGAEDLVWAAKNVDAVASIDANMPVVGLAFKHALSRVKFTFENGMASDAYKLTVSGVQIDNAFAKGTMALPEAAWVGETPVALAFDAPVAAIGNEASAATGYQYIIPGEQNLTLSFDVEVDVNGVKTTYSHNAVALVLPENLEAYANGFSYNFKAVLTASNIDPDNELLPIVFSASVEPWGDDNDIDVTVDK